MLYSIVILSELWKSLYLIHGLDRKLLKAIFYGVFIISFPYPFVKCSTIFDCAEKQTSDNDNYVLSVYIKAWLSAHSLTITLMSCISHTLTRKLEANYTLKIFPTHKRFTCLKSIHRMRLRHQYMFYSSCVHVCL